MHTHSHTHNRSMTLCPGLPGWPVPEETFAYSHQSWSPDILYQLPPSTTIHSKSRHHDWFDDQDAKACQLLDTMHATHFACINDKSNSSKKPAYTRACSAAQRRLRQMKNEWWAKKAQDRNYSKQQIGGTWRLSTTAWVQCTFLEIHSVYLYALVIVLPSSPIDKAYCLTLYYNTTYNQKGHRVKVTKCKRQFMHK